MSAHYGKLVVWIIDVGKEDVSLVGGKGANLGEIAKLKYPVPPGFIITTNAYHHFIKENNLNTKIKHLLSTVNFNKPESLMQVSNHIQSEILKSEISKEMIQDIFKNYTKLGGLLDFPLVAIRSSVTSENTKKASSAGLSETFLNIKGEASLILKIKEGWASLYDPKAILYRHQNQLDHHTSSMALIVQRMVQSEASGVMFTIDPLSGDKTKVIIEAGYGLGEIISQGLLLPDRYEVNKEDTQILSKKVSKQLEKIVKKNGKNEKVNVGKVSQDKQKITDPQIQRLAELGKLLEKHYYFPQDVEWAIEKNRIYLLQTRPVTTIKQEKKIIIDNTPVSPILLMGDPASPGIATGPIKIVHSARDIDKVLPGDILVTSQANSDFIPALKKASAIIADFGGKMSDGAILAREQGIPAVVGTRHATSALKNGNVVTVNGLTGEIHVGGYLKPAINSSTSPLHHQKTATKVYINLNDRENTETIASLNVDGVGSLSAEGVFSKLGTHPKKLIKEGKSKILVDELVSHLEYFCQIFSPRPVIYKLSDFKTNEYRALIGGKEYEPIEPNPVLGYRGAYRLILDPELLLLELEAVKKVREEKGFSNLSITLPFVRTQDELKKIKSIVAKSGLTRSPTFKLWLSVEIPSNIISLDKFIDEGIDGVVISENLSMLMLGVDSESTDIFPEFSDQNESLLWAYGMIIRSSDNHQIPTMFSKQIVSTDLADRLIELGIKGISVSPAAIDETRRQIRQKEKKIIGV